MKVHLDDDLEPFFDVSLPCGREIQTIDGHLEPFADTNAAPQAAPQRFLVVHHRGDKVLIPYEISDCGSDVRRKIEHALGLSVAMKHIRVAGKILPDGTKVKGKTLGEEDLYENVGDLGIDELSTITVLTGTFGRGGQKHPSRASNNRAVDERPILVRRMGTAGKIWTMMVAESRTALSWRRLLSCVESLGLLRTIKLPSPITSMPILSLPIMPTLMECQMMM